MPNKYYFLTDFITRDQFMQLRQDFEKLRESNGQHSDNWGPGELEKYALETGIITMDQYEKITQSVLM